ncbi:hypothetical protein K530_05400 [Streptomyces noursei CCRC 11814]|nr:hypothetical protein K530_05400 [Streptomyces noursei CCRC 11814]
MHVRGWLEPVGDRESSLQIITETVAAYERDLGTGWDMTESLGYFRQLLPGVGAFRLAIDTVDGMFKLSQEQSPEVRERVACEFAARAEARGTALAEHIQRTK